jgi:hypothetical protein
MKSLKIKPTYCTYYVNDGTIYDIVGGTKPVTDAHAIIYDKDNMFPYLRYEDKKGVTHFYYLDSLIEDGDKLVSGSFKKVCHEISGEPLKRPFEYFKYLCERQIASYIADAGKKFNYSYYYDPNNNINRLSLLGVPEYMFQQNYNAIIESNHFDESDGKTGEQIQKANLINFTEAECNRLLEEEILRRAKDAANKVALSYDKEVKTLELQDI